MFCCSSEEASGTSAAPGAEFVASTLARFSDLDTASSVFRTGPIQDRAARRYEALGSVRQPAPHPVSLPRYSVRGVEEGTKGVAVRPFHSFSDRALAQRPAEGHALAGFSAIRQRQVRRGEANSEYRPSYPAQPGFLGDRRSARSGRVCWGADEANPFGSPADVRSRTI